MAVCPVLAHTGEDEDEDEDNGALDPLRRFLRDFHFRSAFFFFFFFSINNFFSFKHINLVAKQQKNGNGRIRTHGI